MNSAKLMNIFLMTSLFALPVRAHITDVAHIHAEQSILMLSVVAILLGSGFVLLIRGKK
ncbi:MAG: hypothetical protein KTR32_09225 [Granulosicoccus sp.]|nr:hypothetical protein [Granulosicoccus sp.]